LPSTLTAGFGTIPTILIGVLVGGVLFVAFKKCDHDKHGQKIQ